MSIPAVKMQSHRETTLALIERIYQLHDSFEYSLEKKREFISTFKKESGYNWQDYERKKKEVRKDRALLSGVSRGFRKLPKEDVMYEEANELGHTVELMQNHYISQLDSTEDLTRGNINTVLMNVNGNHLSFTRSLEHIVENERKGEIPASTFGSAPIRKVVEPLIGKINERKVLSLISARRFDVQLCYESALRRNQALKGEMSWEWRIDTRGKISDIELVQSELPDNKMARCIRKKLASWKFPRARRGSVKILHKFKFRPIKG
ncbi:AgmX/PglI C-terminal domain-containing protein [bacterium]|nr:AgmX/PglI C-terminal domain-containing protein [bacterium]